jgi:hypothetical protein
MTTQVVALVLGGEKLVDEPTSGGIPEEVGVFGSA